MKNSPIKNGLILCTICLSSSVLAVGKTVKRPNFVWFMEEDVSKHYLCLYNSDGSGALMPNVQKLARDGVVFNHAFSNAPVSSAARSTLFTGCYAPRTGMSWHRKLKIVPMPEGLEMFPAYLRKAGYYTCNSSKTDYNCTMSDGTWDSVKGELDEWKKRPRKDMPFFFVRTNALSHESCLHFPPSSVDDKPTKYNLEKVKLPPNHPDTKLFRYTYATFYDRITDTDAELGTLLQMLSDDDLLDDTFIFYFGDNGGSLPGSKGYTSELGLNVPLVVYIPKNWRDKLDIPVGEYVNGFVSFMDFGPTLLHLAGIDVPAKMDGTAFLGDGISLKALNARNKTFGYGDRFDELYAFTRTVRIGKYKYSRNFIPYQPKGFYAFYRYKMEAFKEWKSMYEQGTLTDIQSLFFKPQEPEELYNIELDPYETHNLAKNPDYVRQLKDLRIELKKNMLQKKDLGFYPETVWLNEGAANPTAFGMKNQRYLEVYSDILDLELIPFKDAKPKLEKALKSDDSVEKYWAVTVCAYFGKKARSLEKEILELLNDDLAIVKSRAMLFLSISKDIKPEKAMLDILYSAKSDAEMLQILGDITYMRDYLNTDFHIEYEKISFPIENNQWRIEYINSPLK